MRYFIEENTLIDIADAVREKGGTTEPIMVSELADAITQLPSGGGDIEVEPIVLTGDCTYKCASAIAGNYITLFGNTVSTQNITILQNTFWTYTGERIPFDINCSSSASYITMDNTFANCANLKQAPVINNAKPRSYPKLFHECFNLKEIPENFCSNWDWSYIDSLTGTYGGGNNNQMFQSCYSIRSIPMELYRHGNKETYSGGTCYYYAFSGCYSLDEVKDLYVTPTRTNGNAFQSTFWRTTRLKDFTFETQDDGSPIVAQWTGQVIDMTGVGYVDSSYSRQYLLNYNSGITADKEVTNDTTYQALKNDPDWFTMDINYSRYNHDSAVRTIKSLPDASATGTNTIQFKGAAGALTDGGAINTLTEEEIAVAAAKGWTVTLS